MGRADVVLSVGVAIVLVALVLLGPTAIAAPIVELGLHFWYIGVALVAGSIVLRRQRTLPTAARLLGVVGVGWVAFVLGLVGILLGLVFIRGPIGP